MRLIATVLAASLVACGDDPTSPPVGLSGTYTLQTIDGQAPPFRWYHGDQNVEHYVVGGSIDFTGGNNAALTHLVRERIIASNQWSNPSPFVVRLEYTRSGNNLTELYSPDFGPIPAAGVGGSVSGDGATVTLDFPIDAHRYDGNHRFVFRRD